LATKIAYSCAGIFSVAAVGTNAVYGFSRGDNPASCLIWSAVAIAVSAAFTLAWPATQRALSNKDWPAAAMCAVAAVLFGTFSVAGALGAASAGRTTAAAVETDTTAAKARAQASYSQAQEELSRLEPSRSVAELVPLAEAAKPQCRVRVDGSGSQKVCSKPSALLAELGRAQRRSELQDQIDRASAALATGSVRPANSDSKAVAKYLAAIGIEIGPERITDLLVLLAVLVLEFGPGACLTLALALSGGPVSRPETPSGTVAGQSGHLEPCPVATPDAVPASPVMAHRPARSLSVMTAETDIEAFVRSAGGQLEGFRRLAGALNRPRSTVADECHRLAGAGRLVLAKGRRGMVVSLVARAN
jgi:hypothetical protein